MQLATALGHDFTTEVRTIGPGGDWSGIVAAARELRKIRGFDVIHVWGTRPLTAAAMAGRGPLVYSPAPDLQKPGARWLSSIMQYRDVEVVAPSATLRNALLSTGIAPAKCHLIRPGVDFGRIKRRNPRIRESLGLGKDDLVLLASGESTRSANQRLAAWAAAILGAMDEHWKLLLWGRGPDAARVIEFSRRVYRGSMLVVAEDSNRRVEYEELLGACDIVLNTARGAIATLPLAMDSHLHRRRAPRRSPQRPPCLQAKRATPRPAHLRHEPGRRSQMAPHRHGPHRSIRLFLPHQISRAVARSLSPRGRRRGRRSRRTRRGGSEISRPDIANRFLPVLTPKNRHPDENIP